jgi:maleylacetate reductase
MIAPFVHDSPAMRVVFGSGALAEVGAEVDRLGGTRVMLIAGRSEAAAADSLATQLGDRLVDRVDDVVMHVPRDVADRAVADARRVAVDLVVCVGGGSATGLAKAVARETGLSIVAVPTTYAGSEMTDIWGLTERGHKATGRDPRVRPRSVVYDPVLTLGLPVEVSVASGMNALAHLVEARYAPDATPFTNLAAVEGVRALADALPRIATAPANLEGRTDALYGAWLAGWALGSTTMGLHHRICHVLGGMFDLRHAPTHSAVLPYVTAFNAPAAPEAVAAVAAALGSGMPAAPALWDLADRIGSATSLAAVGLPLEGIDPAVDAILAAPPQNPRPVERESLRALLTAAYDGRRPSAAQ